MDLETTYILYTDSMVLVGIIYPDLLCFDLRGTLVTFHRDFVAHNMTRLPHERRTVEDNR